jgi:cell division protein FtsB
MRPIVNLSRQPFRNRRLFWLAILGIFGVSSYFGLNAIQEKVRLEQQIIAQQESLRKVSPQAAKKTDPKEPLSTLTITPDKNRELLSASELIERRAFSWSQLLNDIERYIPANVRVLRVAVNKVKANDQNAVAAGAASSDDRTILLTLEVVGRSTTDVTRMMTDFERSGIFIVKPREKKVLEGLPDVEFTLDVEYTVPLPRGLRQNTSAQLAENRK